MLNKKLIVDLREEFLQSLRAWKNAEGLYSSIPKSNNTSHTCSGYVAIAFQNSTDILSAQELAVKLEKKIQNSQSSILLNETKTASHIETNSRAISAILQCCPFLHDKNTVLENILWIVSQQNQDGSWDLYAPNSNSTGKAIWTCSALDSLIRYVDIIKQNSVASVDFEHHIQLGLQYLLGKKTERHTGSGLRPWLWSIDGHNTSPVFDMNASIMCLDIIIRSATVLNHEDIKKSAVTGLCDLIESENQAFLNGQRKSEIGMWTTLQEHSPHSYSRTFFAPGCLPSILLHLPIIPSEKIESIKIFSYRHIEWIVDNVVEFERATKRKAVRSSESNPTTTVWATAQAVSSLSAFLMNISLFESSQSSQEAVSILLNLPSTQIYARCKAQNQISLLAWLLAVCSSLLIVWLSIIYIIPHWNDAEPIIYIITLFVALFTFLLPYIFPRLVNSQWVDKFFDKVQKFNIKKIEVFLKKIANL
jgi:hypothetical protein